MQEKADQDIRILVIDDDASVADLLTNYLSNENKQVEACYESIEAMDRIRQRLYDLVIVDMVMPGATGLDVLRCAKETDPEMVVIIITGYASLETAIVAIKEGAYDYIRKPCKLEEIKIAVQNATDKIVANREKKALMKKLADADNELAALRSMKGDGKKPGAINFFSSEQTGLQYLYEHCATPYDYIDKLQILSALNDSGVITKEELKTFKNHLLKKISIDEGIR